MNEYFTVNLIGDGLLIDQIIMDDFVDAQRKAIKYYKENREDYFEDGYVKIKKFAKLNEPGEDVHSIRFDEELEEMEIDFNEEE